ncbi:hypothetical protein BDQ12DRAFT_620482 [Crucibulum laeve]|uniref:Uncharacterized protein n=1 Tax=Crucibulum laeve TaxID=68775 RepID=A0A5C3MHK6_9AGAR|nr:hypothetical protein BDQ12DRAFT_620482 [Crucibulum laeve]
MTSSEQINLNVAHPPGENAIEAFNVVLHKRESKKQGGSKHLEGIKPAILFSRNELWKNEPRMWSRAQHLSDEELTAFTIEEDLVEIRSASTSYGQVILGKIRIPAINDEEGEGFIHVRIHDPPNRGADDVIFHSIFTDEQKDDEERFVRLRAIQTRDTPLEFFNE